MKKKSYMMPQVEVVKIQQVQLLDGSPGTHEQVGSGSVYAPGYRNSQNPQDDEEDEEEDW